MELVYDIATIVQTFAISLGVGTSTVAVTQFIVAMRDKNMVSEERKMLGVVYTLLRIAMVLILITTIFEGGALLLSFGIGAITGAFLSAWTVIAVLFINAVLMTKHLMPMYLGPGIQASAWYTLGFLSALFSIGAQGFAYFEFLTWYAAFVAVVIILINGALTFFTVRESNSVPPQSTQPSQGVEGK